jgi:transcription initiation factor TFIIB
LIESSTQPSESKEPQGCPLCGETRIYTDMYSGEEVCTKCGLVINDPPVSYLKENYSHNYEEHEEHTRHGTYITQSAFDRGFNTVIQGAKDHFGTPLSNEAAMNMRRLQRQDNRSKMDDTVTRNLNVAMMELDRLSTALHLPNLAKEYAAYTYRKALSADLVRGRSIDSFVTASVYVACRMLRIPRSLKLVAEESKRDYQEVSMTYRLLLKELNIRAPLDEPQKYIPRLASILNVPRSTERLAMNILIAAKKTPAVTGKDPRGVAGAALYYALDLTGEKMVQRRIAKASDTTEVTLRNRYRELKRVLGGKVNSLY